MPSRLSQNPFACVDQDDGEVRGRGAGDHVAGILFVAGRVGDDELALFRRKEAVGDIDGDALLALGGEAVDEQCKVDVLALRAHSLAVALQSRELILEDHLRVIQQPADQRRFAVIDAATGDEAQQTLVLVLKQIGVDVLGNECVDLIGRGLPLGCHLQKYPSCFFFSMLAV